MTITISRDPTSPTVVVEFVDSLRDNSECDDCIDVSYLVRQFRAAMARDNGRLMAACQAAGDLDIDIEINIGRTSDGSRDAAYHAAILAAHVTRHLAQLLCNVRNVSIALHDCAGSVSVRICGATP